MAAADDSVLLLPNRSLVLQEQISSQPAYWLSAHPCGQVASQGMQGQVVAEPSHNAQELQE
jgi:hypothetical protein